MGIFAKMLCLGTTAGLLSRLLVGRMNLAAINASYLLFADDTIIVCDHDCEQMVNLRYILVWLEAVLRVNLRFILVWIEAVSRLRVNLTKSSLMLAGQVDNVKLLSTCDGG